VIILAEDEEVRDVGEIAMMEEVNNINKNLGKKVEMACQWMDLSICSAGGMTERNHKQ